MEEDDASSSDPDADQEDNDIPHVLRTRDPVRGRRGASVDLTNFRRDVVSHHATTHIPSHAYIPTAENTPEESPTPSAANLSVTRLTPPPDQGSPQSHSPSRVQSNSLPVQRDQRHATSGTGSNSTPYLPSRRRASQALEDFRRALRPDLNVPSVQQTPPQIDIATLAPPILSPPLYTPPNESQSRLSSRSPDGFDDDTYARRRSRTRFSLSAISDAIFDSVRSRPPLAAKRVEGTPVRFDAQDSEKSSESMRGRSREKGKGKNRDLSQALIKVSEVLGLEPEEEFRDGWKEFKKGAFLPNIIPVYPAPHDGAAI